MARLHNCQVFELLIARGISVISDIAYVCGLGAEEEHQDELDHEEDLEHVEEPEPAQSLEDLSADDGGQTGCGVENEVDERNPRSSLVNEIDVANN